MSHVKAIRAYSRAEYLSDAVVHGLGISGALVAGPVLIALAAVWVGDPNLVGALAIYTLSLVVMWVSSALYNLVQREDLKPGFRRLDQSAIYFKIAGTYTPFVALASGSFGFLAGIWMVALAGASVILLSKRTYIWLAIGLYLGLGWAGAIFGGPLLSGVTPLAVSLLIAGGLTYSFGIIFLMWRRLPFHNTIWHICVLAGTAICYGAIVAEILHSAAVT
ncbi:MAG: hemolysin III family protein [Roseicyclus sp.]|nr:hemolysin III family protein [Roseicyclus sp.]